MKWTLLDYPWIASAFREPHARVTHARRWRAVRARGAAGALHIAHGVSMRTSLFGLVASFLVGCAVDGPVQREQAEAVTAQQVPRTTGSFQGHYVVPAPADIASAATFTMAEVDWTIASNTVTLHYELPVGLVGGTLSITLSGPLPSGATSASLTSTN